MKKNLITGLTLGLFALICGLMLSVVNMITGPIIKIQNEEKAQLAIKEVCPQYDMNTFDSVEIEHSEQKEIVSILKVTSKEDASTIYCIYTIDVTGYASTIRMMICVNSSYEIVGYKVISSQETKGDIKAHDFNMTGKKNLDEFDKLAGSSVSSKAVRKCFNIALYYSHLDM